MEQKQLTKAVIIELTKSKKSFKSTYEQKSFVIGITSILTVSDAPETIRDPGTISRLLLEILQMLE